MNPATGRRDLVANRWEAFVHVLAFEGVSLAGATFAAAIRAVKDAAGAPLITLASADPASQGVALLQVATETIDFGAGIGVLTVPVSYVQLRINETVVEGLPKPSPVGSDIDFWWDLQVVPASGDKYRAIEGKFTAHAGVTGSS